ncbi:hypothetical protein BDW67DRAFT_170464 [Aspergillus spinulosporus]
MLGEMTFQCLVVSVATRTIYAQHSIHLVKVQDISSWNRQHEICLCRTRVLGTQPRIPRDTQLYVRPGIQITEKNFG